MTRRSRLTPPLSVAPTVLPHEPDLAREHKEAILEALRWAWKELGRRDPSALRNSVEESVTVELQELLNAHSEGERRARWLKDFESVTRGEKQVTADGRIQKEPDLTFRPTPYPTVMNTTHWGWFVECKIIDDDKPVTRYRDKGVHRFSSGEYAAWMQSGAMVAYVRDRSTPWPTLNPALTGHVGTKHHVPGPTDDRSESEHDRARLSNPCVDVTLTHLWLQAT